MNYVRRLSQRYQPKEFEEELLEFWEKNRIYEKLREKLKDKPKFYFLDGPPYPSSDTPHIGTVWNKVLKDSIIRFWRARGYCVNDTPGYDCHGLPIEVKVEQSLGFKSKKEIEEFGIDKFVKKCEEFALNNVNSMSKHFKNFGVSMDWKKPYLTLDMEYMQCAWWLIKRAHEQGLLERGVKVVHWCPRCETTLADYEVTEYKILKDPSIYVKLPIRGRDKVFLLIWTTTPWTLPANVAAMVHPELDYVWVKVGDEVYVMVKDRLEAVMNEVGIKEYSVLKEVKGRELAGLKYVPPLLEEVKLQRELKDAHKVVLSELYVTAEEGTGIVHTAPGHGEEDYEVGMEYNLPVVAPVDDKGVFTEDAGKYSGKYIRDANEEIIQDLRKKGLLLHAGYVEHRYPVCWRCKTPLILRATPQWYIRIKHLKDKFLEEAAKVNWVPEWAGYARFKNWLLGLRDWVISRQRYWGTPVPIWVCDKCGEWVVIGSLKELEDYTGRKLELQDLHRPWIDQITFKCPKCGGVMKRVPDVLDVWLDSGVASWASLKYPLRKDLYDKLWPVDFITEGHDQIAGWFFSLLRSGIIAFGRVPYKSVLMHGFALDEEGKEMHKSLGNYIAPDEVLEYRMGGRDILRWFVLRNTVWEDLRFSWKRFDEAFDDLSLLWNVYLFASTYMSLDKFDPSKHTLDKYMDYLRIEDKWILSRVERLCKSVTEAFERLHIHRAVRELREFIIEDMSHWYVRLVRPRVWVEKEDPDKLAAYATLYYVLRKFLVLLSPILPFITEKIYLDSFKAFRDDPESVHMLSWPEYNESFVDEKLEKAMFLARKVVERGLAARMRANIKVRQPLRRLYVFVDGEGQEYVRIMKKVISSQVNVKEVVVKGMDELGEFFEIRVEPVMAKMGPVFKKETGKVLDLLAKVDPLVLREKLESKGEFLLVEDGSRFLIKPEYVEFVEEIREGYTAERAENFAVVLTTKLSREELAEGLARDVLRRIQYMRKELDLPVDAFIEVVYATSDEAFELLKDYVDYIMGESRAKVFNRVAREAVKGDLVKEWSINGYWFVIGIKLFK